MLRSLLEWNRRRKNWNAEHARAWAGATARSADGRSPLQRLCEETLTQALTATDYHLAERAIVDEANAPCVRARIAGTALSIWLYDDTVGFEIDGQHSRFEEWDFLTPEALAQAFTEAVVAALHERRPRAV